MRASECLHLANAGVAQPDADDALVLDVVDPLDQTCGDGSIHELDDAVVSEQQVLGHLADRRRPTVTADGEQQLVLGARQPDRLGLVLAPTQEPS